VQDDIIKIYKYLPDVISKMNFLKYLSTETNMLVKNNSTTTTGISVNSFSSSSTYKTLQDHFHKDLTTIFDSCSFDEKLSITKKSIAKVFNRLTEGLDSYAHPDITQFYFDELFFKKSE
jgi:hypothetical protein